MEGEETRCSSGYGKPPWIFKGSALYQFHLVKADIARAIIPKDFRLVEAFGYTLGGFFLANYNESPFGSFDEELCGTRQRLMHGRQEFMSTMMMRAPMEERSLDFQVKLPHFQSEQSIKAISRRPKEKSNGFLTATDVGSDTRMDIQVAEINGSMGTHLYDIGLASPALEMNPLKWMGPTIKMSLPSFSGHTEHKPQLLKYYCGIECRVRPTSPASVLGSSHVKRSLESGNAESEECLEKRELSMSVMLSKPILALEFNCLKMKVEPPVVVSTSL